MSTPFVVERYVVARQIWKRKDERAHDGFPATDKRAAVPAQSYAEWFEWAYGMNLEEYAEIAKIRDHAGLVKRTGAVVVEYKLHGDWHICICAAGESKDECAASLKAMFPEITDVRERT